MKLFDIMANTNYKLIQGDNVDIGYLTIDSRAVEEGFLFFCVKGLTFDGHDFMAEVAKKGALAIVIDKQRDDYPKDVTILQVTDVRTAMSLAAANFYGHPTKSFDLIGITGTNGKTSSAYILESVLKAYGKLCGVIGTVKTRVGGQELDIKLATKISTTPDSIDLQKIFAIMRDEKADTVVMEVTSHALALRKTVGLNYKIGIFTNITQDHLDFHETFEEYKLAKARLFKDCEISIFNLDDPFAPFMIKQSKGKIITFGVTNDKSDYRAINVQVSNQGISYDLEINGKLERFKTAIRGKFTVYNTLGVVVAALALNIPVEIIKGALENMEGVPGRIQSVPNECGLNIIVDFAHTPDGFESLLSSAREFTTGKVMIIFGCGGDRDKTKRPIMGKIAGELTDYCFITCDNPRTENPDDILDNIEEGLKPTQCPFERIKDRKEAIYKAVSVLTKDDLLLIVGKGHETYQIFANETVYFSDFEVAQKAVMALDK